MSRTSSILRFSLIAGLAAILPAMKPITAPAVFAPAAAVRNQSSAPDSYGYKWIDNQGADDPAAGGAGPSFQAVFQDISSSGTQITGNVCDDCINPIAPQMMIRYYGQNWGVAPAGSGAQIVSANIYVSTNGTIQFLNSGQNPSASYSNTALPGNGMNGMVAFLWDDCYGASGGNWNGWQVVGNPPNRRLIVQYNSWDWCCSDGPNMQYQVQFSESDGSADSTIHFVYSDITNADGRECGNSATIGIQSPTQNSYLQYSFNTASLADDRVIRFYTNQSPDAPTNLSQTDAPGGASMSVGFISDATVTFRGTGTDPDATNTVGIQVEILPSTTPFDPTNVTGQSVSTPAGSLVAQGQVAEATYTFTGNPYGSGDYHWRARTIDNAGGTSAWTLFNAALVHFTVDLTPPGPVSGPFQPEEGATVGVAPPGSDVLFRWGDSVDSLPGPIIYRIQVSASPGFAGTLADETLNAHELLVVLNISDNPYYWRVAGIDQAGNQGPWTLPMSFQVIFKDDVNHGGGDCSISVVPGVGPLLPAVFAAALLAYGLGRRRRA